LAREVIYHHDALLTAHVQLLDEPKPVDDQARAVPAAFKHVSVNTSGHLILGNEDT
jgi:hypothetical protein